MEKLKKYMAVLIRGKLVFIGKIQFSSSSSLENVIDYWPKLKFKHLLQEFERNQLESVKQRRIQSSKYTNSFERFNKKRLSKEECFNYSLKDKHVRNEHNHKLEHANTSRKNLR